MKLGCSYFGNRVLRHAVADMRELKECGCDYVVHTFSENDLTFYRKAVGEIVAASQDIGLEVHIDPWGVGKVFGGEAFTQFALHNTDALQIASDGLPGGAACPNNPKFQAFMRDWTDAAAETGAEVAFWDEPHFYLPHWLGGRPGTWGCRCAVCREGFAERFGRPMPDVPDADVLAFKQDSIERFLAALVAGAKERGMRNCLCVLPHGDAADSTDDWQRIAQIPGLDIFGTDPYWLIAKKDLGYVEAASRLVKKVADSRGLESQVWLQGFRVPGGREHELVEAVDIMVREGIRDVAVWGFLACEHLSWIRPDDAALCWTTIKDKFRRLREQYG